MSQLQLYKGLSFGILTIFLIGFFLLMDAYLESNFSYHGEAFLKGYGHLLRENWSKGLFFVSLINFIPALLLSYLFFLFQGEKDRRISFKIVRITAIVVFVITTIYVGEKTIDIVYHQYDRVDRVVEIGITWWLRVAGLLLGYALVKMDIEQKLIRHKYAS
jgi:hypothetical protein